jgi:hypothetical protein
MTLMIDPPSGWRYGFPKVYDNPNDLSVEEWLLENGYPSHEMRISVAPYVRFIYDDDREVKRGAQG